MPHKKAAPLQSALISPPMQEVHVKPHESYLTRRQQDPSLPMAIVIQSQIFHQRWRESKSVSEAAILESLRQNHLVGIPMHFRNISEPFKLCPDESTLKFILKN